MFADAGTTEDDSVMASRVDDEARNGWHRDAIAGLSAALREAPDAAVSYYPEWTLRDLVVHVIRVHVMACASLGEGGRARPSFDVDVGSQAPADVLAGELDRVAERLRTDVDACPHRAVWSPTPTSSAPPGFWRRRMLSESVLHRWDAESALGRSWAPGPGLVEEVIDEFLMSRVDPLAGEAHAAVVALDVGSAQWSVAVAGDAEATVAADPVDLWLWLNRRADSASVEVRGSRSAVAELEASLDGLRPARR